MIRTAEPTIAAAALVARRGAARRIAPGLALLAALAALPARPIEAASDPYRRLHPYVGDIHVHSGLALYRVLDPNAPHSLGDADEILDAAAIRGLDFVAITDHTNNLDDPRGLAWRKEHGAEFTLPDGTRTASEFAYVQSQIARLNRPGRFVTILGLEYTRGTTENAAPGHQLGLFPGDSLPRYCSNFPQNVGDCLTVRDFYAFVAQMKGIAVMAHPCVTWGASDWSEVDPVLNSMELTAGKCEFGKSGYNEVLAKGLRIGARGSSDQHHFEVGLNDKTICFAPELTRGAILAAMRANLCYWVDQHPITLTFSIDGSPMGSEVVARGGKVEIAAAASTEWQTELDHIELIHDGSVAARENCDDNGYARCALHASIAADVAGYYYVAVSNGSDHRVAISSPIWVRSGR